MRFRVMNILALVVFVCGSVLAQYSSGSSAVSNPAGHRSIRGPLGYRSSAARGTTPVGSGSGLHRSPNPINTTGGNLMMTGNVRGGRHFRGVMPYGSTTDFGQSLGSTTLDSFRRSSTGLEDLRQPTGTVRPYYSSTGTVTSLRPGYRGVFRSPASRIDYYDSGLDTTLDLRSRRILEDTTQPAVAANKYRPMTPIKKDMDKLFSRDSQEFIRYQSLIDDKYKIQRERFKLGVEQAADKKKDLLKGTEREDLLELEADKTDVTENISIPQSIKIRPTRKTPQMERINTEDSRYLYAKLQRERQPEAADIFEQMQRDIDGLKEIMAAQEEERKAAEAKADEVEKKPEKEDETKKEGLAGTFGDPELLARKAKEKLKAYDSFASLADDRFNVYMRVGEEYMKKGRFYMAANAYSIASAYKPENPLTYAGRCHALFAAGEYMSSAFFLSRTLDIFPEYASLKINLEAMTGDKDKLEFRVSDAEEILKISEERGGEASGELQFLLGYIYHQMGLVGKAKSNIEAAHDKMSDSGAVIILKKVIDATEETPLK
ncbi:MAG: hypothetical protein ACYSSI_06545 [Planctomycetota bacterium]|jgi:hypothetical protein